MANEITVESAIPALTVRQLHDDAHRSLKSIATEARLDTQLVRDLYHGSVLHVTVATADALYAVQAKAELANPKLARRWAL